MAGKPTTQPETLEQALLGIRVQADLQDRAADAGARAFAARFRSALREPDRPMPAARRRMLEAFLAAADQWLLEQDAVPNTGTLASYPIELPGTRAGALLLHNYGTWVACIFRDVPAAVAAFPGMARYGGGINPHSGKYNLHFDDHLAAAARLELLKQHVGLVMPVPAREP